MAVEPPGLDAVARAMSAHVPLYAWRRPVYQREMLAGLVEAWNGLPRRILDVGGGTGLMAQVIHDLYPSVHVTTVDVQDRFLATVSVETGIFDGTALPYESGSFDCLLLLNVLHHVSAQQRAELILECLRVTGGGPLHIKDHLSEGSLDKGRLWALDLLGNAPFGGMVRAEYLDRADWAQLAGETGCTIERHRDRFYRRGPLAALFPNRLEIMTTWRSAR